MALQFRRGLDSDRGTITPLAGEPVFVTDTNRLFIGDGTSAGGKDIVTEALGSVKGHIVPETDSTYDLGDSSKKFRDLYLSGNSIYLGNNLILSNDGGTFTAKDSSNTTIDISLAANTTDDLSEGSSNLYYTTARANSAFDDRLATKTADNLTEGSTNLYYTNARVDNRIPSVVDSAYVQARQTSSDGSGLDSSETIALIDSAYVQARQTSSGGGNDSATTIALIDSDYVQARQDFAYGSLTGTPTIPTLGTDFIDSAEAIKLITANAIDSSVALQLLLDSIETIALIDSAYVAARAPASTDSAATQAMIDSSLGAQIDSDYIQARQTTPIPSFTKISISGQGDVVADDSAALPNWASGTQQAKLTASDGAAGDAFGHGVSISEDGNYAVVGAYNDDDGGTYAGTAFVYIRSGTTWTQQAKIQASDAAGNDYFGNSCAIDADGDTIIVGARKENSNAGAAYVFTRSGTTWTQQAKISAVGTSPAYFGKSVAIADDGDTVAIGCDGGGSPSNSGQVATFTRSGSTWSHQQTLTASDAAANDYFGRHVTISGDGLYISSGSIEDDGGGGSGSGSAYIFFYSGSSWSQQAKIAASDGASNDKFGRSVSLDQDGDTIIVGAYQDHLNSNNNGSAYIFTRSGTSWSQQAKLTASGTPSNDDEFGNSVSISNDGNVAVSVARREANSGAGDGTVYIFTRDDTTWTEQLSIFGTENVGGNLAFEPHAMDISGDGQTIIAGNHGASSTKGHALVFNAPLSVLLSDTLTLEAGSNVTLTSTPGTDTIAIASSTDSTATQAMIDSSIGFQVDSAYVQARQSGGEITIQEEGSSLSTAATTLNFVGSSVTASGTGTTKTITITGGGGNDSATTIALIDSSYVQARQNPGITQVDSSLSSTDSAQIIDSFAAATYRTVKYVAQLTDSGRYHSEEILLSHDGTNVAMTSYGKLLLDSDLGTFDGSISGGNVRLTLSPTYGNTSVKLRAIRTEV